LHQTSLPNNPALSHDSAFMVKQTYRLTRAPQMRRAVAAKRWPESST
jgi:hypothetical protein